ncbi:MAG: dihydropteroate synthase [Armatimonadota bacterium]|nr:dihydropteroate synthase [bacterium]
MKHKKLVSIHINDQTGFYRVRMVNMPHKARVLCLKNDSEINREMKLIDTEDAGARHMLPKAQHYLVKLEKVRRPIVHILKEAFLSSGGDAAISRNVITAKITDSDVILMGTRKQFQYVLRSLLEQGFGCKELAVEIESAIRHFDSTPNVPTSELAMDHRLAEMFTQIGSRTLVMGILNITPDSFSDGGKYADTDAIVEAALRMVEDGADIIDIGGESTRPGSDAVSTHDEIERVVPAIRKIAPQIKVPISIDTYKAEVAAAALDAGAFIVNDISGATFDVSMPHMLAERRCPVVIMHIKGSPKNMQTNPEYDDLLGEVHSFLRKQMRTLVDAGVDERAIIIDPGFGFGKTVAHNLELLRRLREFTSTGRPILVGTSRKSTVGQTLGGLPPNDRVEGTAATVAISIANGADIVRVHDVKEMARVAKMSDAIVRGR